MSMSKRKKTAKKKRLGRPKKKPEEVRRRYLQVRIDDQEKEGFHEAAQLSGLPLSNWVRDRLRRVASQELKAAGHSVPFH